MDIKSATRRYEAWVRRQARLLPEDIALKHRRMTEGPFLFMRATFYRWAQLWPEICPELAAAPEILAIGDLHIENFGTWRDHEGRLVWGINDFDECFTMPYTIDLVRLATSALLASEASQLTIDAESACAAILQGYGAALGDGGGPLILEEEHHWLRDIALGELRDPVRFWAKMGSLPESRDPPPRKVRRWLEEALPEAGIPYRIAHRVAGLGSLGRERHVALAAWRGGLIAREAKALTQSAYAWTTGAGDGAKLLYKKALRRAIRCPDPSIAVHGTWLIRRLAPHCSRIELANLPKGRDEAHLLRAMGRETANIHLGSSGAGAIAPDLVRRKGKWLAKAAQAMAAATIADWQDWKR